MNINKRKIGIMGGSFNPPHLGHLISAEYVAQELELEKVLFIPTGETLYKSSAQGLEPKFRYEMTRLAVKDNPCFDISDIETNCGGITYTYATLQKLCGLYEDTQFYFIVGADSLDYMESWRNPQIIFDLCTVVAVSRKGFSAKESEEKAKALKEQFGADIRFIAMPNIELSSTEIKERIAQGKSVKYMIPDPVIKYIEEMGFYKADAKRDTE